jgi:hypothetical protein
MATCVFVVSRLFSLFTSVLVCAREEDRDGGLGEVVKRTCKLDGCVPTTLMHLLNF